MKLQTLEAERIRVFVCIVLTTAIAIATPRDGKAQGAIQAVRQRVQGLGGPGAPPSDTPPGGAGPERPLSPGANGAKLDVTYVSPNSAVLLVMRPAQILASPIAQTFPLEVASAAAVKYVGFDLVDVEEVVAFLDLTNPIAPSYGLTIKFTKPFRAAALPPTVRPAVQLSELNGKKYLQSAHPLFPSFYGPNNKTMIAAPDAMLKQIVSANSGPKSGKLLDMVHDIPAGNDLYLALDLVPLRPMMQMGLAQAQAQQKAPPEAKQYLEALNQVSAAELTVNIVAMGPISLVLHGNDEPAAQQIETFLRESVQKYQTAAAEPQPGGDDTMNQAMSRYRERMSRPLQPTRNGTAVTCFHIDAQDQSQRQFIGGVLFGYAAATAAPMLEREHMGPPKAVDPSAPATPPGAPPGAAPAP
jgi:hypothetical protein